MTKKSDDKLHFERASALATDLRLVFGQLKRRLLSKGDLNDFTNSQIAAIVHLDKHGPNSITELARAEGIRSQSMGTTVTTLENMGLLEGTPDPSDGRRTIYSLTPKCVQMLESGRAARQDLLVRQIQEKLLPEEQEELARAVALLKRIAEF